MGTFLVCTEVLDFRKLLATSGKAVLMHIFGSFCLFWRTELAFISIFPSIPHVLFSITLRSCYCHTLLEAVTKVSWSCNLVAPTCTLIPSNTIAHFLFSITNSSSHDIETITLSLHTISWINCFVVFICYVKMLVNVVCKYKSLQWKQSKWVSFCKSWWI